MEISSDNKKTKNLTLKKSRLKAYKFALLSVLFALATIILSLISYHLYLNNVEINYELKEVRKDIDLSAEFSQEDAEALNLSLILPSKPSDNFKKSSLVNSMRELPFLDTDEKSYRAFLINEDLQVVDAQSKVGNLPIFSIKNIDLITESDYQKIIERISNKVRESNIKRFELDISFSNLDNYLDFLKDLKLEQFSEGISIGIYIYPKWGDYVDYSFFAPITNSFSTNSDLDEVLQYVDYIKIKSYDYTGPKDILPGAISPKTWFKQILQYYTKKDYNKEKIFFGINTQAYEWGDRVIAFQPKDNYSLLQEEAKVYSRSDFLKLKEGMTLDPMKEDGIDESIYRYNINGVEFITIFPENELIVELEELVKSYGFGGIFYK